MAFQITSGQRMIVMRQNYLSIKRLLDIVFTLLILMPLCLILLVMVPIIRFDSCGPIIFRQRWVGLPYKLHGDLRVTRVGRILRKACIDELPQFLNMLRGEMALVEPLPPLPYEVELYGPREVLRLMGKPGLTGVWQVYGRSYEAF